MPTISIEMIAIATTGIMSLATFFFGTKFYKAKKEVTDLFVILDKAFEDDKISSKELKDILKEAREAVLAIKGLFKKK